MLNSNLKVFVVDVDIYARLAISTYLGWDRRTRVTQQFSSLQELEAHLSEIPFAELPDTILVDGLLLPTAKDVHRSVEKIYSYHPEVDILVLAHEAHIPVGQAARKAGGNGYLIREEIGLGISWLVVWARKHGYPFVITPSLEAHFADAVILPSAREYPDLTERIRQALLLCVIEGMSAELAADEMGLSPHTIRTYIKEGYSILEAGDKTEYPPYLSPQEKAFMRFTALQLDHLGKELGEDVSKDIENAEDSEEDTEES